MQRHPQLAVMFRRKKIGHDPVFDERSAVSRSALLIVALWAIIAAPVLCEAGVLAHPGECADGEVEACDHEADCDLDPCSEQILRKDESSEGPTVDAGPVAPAQHPAGPAAVALFDDSGGSQNAPSDFTPPLGVPHASDLPLLI